MKLKNWLILSALVAGTNVWAADTPAATPAEGASPSIHKAEESAKKTAADAKEAAPPAAAAAPAAPAPAELAVGNTSQNAAAAARQAAKDAEKAAQFAAHKAAEATRKATAATRETAQKVEDAAKKAALASAEALKKAEVSARQAARSGEAAARKAAEDTRDAARHAMEATKAAAEKAFETNEGAADAKKLSRRRRGPSGQLHPHRLMVRCLGRGIDAVRLEPLRQSFGEEDEIEAFGLLDKIHRVDADRGCVRFAGMQHGPGIVISRRPLGKWGENLRTLGCGGGKIHVAAQQRLRGPGKYLEGPARLLRHRRAPGQGAGFRMQVADGVDLGLALALRVVLEVGGQHT